MLKSKVLCQICQQYKDHSKYRRHLRIHQKQGKISLEEIGLYSFQTRCSHLNSRERPHSIKTGYRCYVKSGNQTCSSIVFDLHSHLIRVHGLSTSDQMYAQAFDDASPHEKQVFFAGDLPRRNPMHDYGRSGIPSITPKLINTLSTHAILKDKTLDDCVEELDIDSQKNYDVYEFPPSEDIDISSSNTYIPPQIKDIISQEFINTLNLFREHLGTVSGGSRSETFSRKDFRNIIHFINDVGENSLFLAKSINNYLSIELKRGNSPSTLSSRVLSLSRFIDYLKGNNTSLLPIPGELHKLTSMLAGVKITLNKLGKKRRHVIMQKNRDTFDATIHVLKEWRDKRKDLNYSSLFRSYVLDDCTVLNQADYVKMRDYLITELIIPNGQRPGVISGVTIGEMTDAKKNITGGYHKLMVTCHKTRDIQSAVLFIYPEIYAFFDVFLTTILRKLPCYNNSDVFGRASAVFQTFNGDPIPSSRITPILRNFLSDISINFVGTITDLRKAAATLTGKYNPKIHDLMALFMCHSRAAHDKYYKINIGHDGLVDAFKSLENFHSIEPSPLQSPCNVDLSSDFYNGADILDTSFHTSSQFSSPRVFNRNIPLLAPNDTTTKKQSNSNSTFSCSFPVSSPNQLNRNNSINDLTFSDTFISKNQFSSQSTTLGIVNQSNEFPPVEESTPNQVENNVLFPAFSSNSPPGQLSNIDSVTESIFSPTVSNPIDILHESDDLRSRGSAISCSLNDVSHSSISRRKSLSNALILRDFHIPLMDLSSLRKESAAVTQPPKETRLFHQTKEQVYLDVFAQILDKIRQKLPITRREILDTAFGSSLFSPLLKDLKNHFSNVDTENKIVNKVRYFGSKRTIGHNSSDLTLSSSDDFLDVSIATENYIRHKKRNKSIFFLRKDELLFRNLFSDLINRVTKHQKVQKYEILHRIEDVRFIPVLARLRAVYSFDVYPKLLAKVRTVGISKRIKRSVTHLM